MKNIPNFYMNTQLRVIKLLLFTITIYMIFMTSEGMMALASGGSISGRITNAANGAAIAGVEMYADNGLSNAIVYTDSAGNYLFNNLAAGGYNIVATKLGFAKAHRYGVGVTENGTTDGVDFALTDKMGQVSGRVVDTAGNPIVRANVLADSEEGTGFGATLTDGGGYYLLPSLAPMHYYIHVSAEGYTGLIRIVEVLDGQTTENVNFVLGQNTGKIQGRITKDGQPSSNAHVYVNSSAGSSQIYYDDAIGDSNGYYGISSLPPGNYDVHVYDVPGYANQYRINVGVGNGVTIVDFNLINGDSTIIGHVTNPGGNSLQGVKVQAFLTENPGTWGSVFTDANGNYVIEKLWPGFYNFYADLFPYSQEIRTNVYIAGGISTRVDFIMGSSRMLISKPPQVTAVVEKGQGKWLSLYIDVNAGEPTIWNATTTASWLFLGETGDRKEASGVTGEILELRFDPGNLDFSTYASEIEITATDATPTSVPVLLMVVKELHQAFLPLLNR